MGSYSSTMVDDFEVWGSKSYADDDSLSIFQERDKRVTLYIDPDDGDDAEEQHRVEYVVTAAQMRDRLDAMGFTLFRAAQSYRGNHAAYVEMHEGWLEQDRRGVGLGVTSDEEVNAIKTRGFDWWTAAVAKLVPLGWSMWRWEDFEHIPESKAFHDMDALGSFFSDDRLFLRAMLDALPNAGTVSLDISYLVGGGYYEKEETICDNARFRWSQSNPVYGPTVILTEGKLDSRVLARAFEAISPHLVDFFGFLDFDGVALPGSTDNLAKLVRAFVGARLSSRIVAVFDNDTAGVEALEALGKLNLPPNIKAIVLPHNPLATEYPTEGPQGPAIMDVNGLACSIEMFFGREALTNADGKLIPVRWSGYNAKMQRYQGAIEAKGNVQVAFFELLKEHATPESARAAFPEMATVVDRLTLVFAEDVVADEPHVGSKEQGKNVSA